ncbi:hypothetical protein SMD44_04194 [Streptomyces alboflavus]|uniref:Uncharacterized protein n=1 Tax=Streptomyces alboflavus TaxID=67267 RepID=A0A1Z1WEH9_9ACTN|nr:hypothetical protein SMD44_04194 [Streptomyces alboflavus]
MRQHFFLVFTETHGRHLPGATGPVIGTFFQM